MTKKIKYEISGWTNEKWVYLCEIMHEKVQATGYMSVGEAADHELFRQRVNKIVDENVYAQTMKPTMLKAEWRLTPSLKTHDIWNYTPPRGAREPTADEAIAAIKKQAADTTDFDAIMAGLQDALEYVKEQRKLADARPIEVGDKVRCYQNHRGTVIGEHGEYLWVKSGVTNFPMTFYRKDVTRL